MPSGTITINADVVQESKLNANSRLKLRILKRTSQALAGFKMTFSLKFTDQAKPTLVSFSKFMGANWLRFH